MGLSKKEDRLCNQRADRASVEDFCVRGAGQASVSAPPQIASIHALHGLKVLFPQYLGTGAA